MINQMDSKLLKCKICSKEASTEPGWINISAIMVPLCEGHLREYRQFKRDMLNGIHSI